MAFDPEINMMRGFTFFELDIPKYETKEACTKQGMKLIAKAKEKLKLNNIKTGEWEITCIELKGEKA
jgi:hypothetical protein